MQNNLIAQLGMVVGELAVRYLDVSLISCSLSKVDCQPLVDKVRKKLSLSTAKFLSYAGRCRLLKAIVIQMQVYWSMPFMLPKAVILKIEAMCEKFLWSGKLDRNPMTLVALRQVCLPKSEGGIGLKQMEQCNRAAISKYIWRVVTNGKSLWVVWCKVQLLKGKSIWRVSIPQDVAWTWRKILQVSNGMGVGC